MCFNVLVFNDNTNLQQVYVKQLKSLKQSLIHQQSSVMNINNTKPIISVASIYSKLLLFLSSLYSIKAETMQILFCQHLLHNPTYSYLVNSWFIFLCMCVCVCVSIVYPG